MSNEIFSLKQFGISVSYGRLKKLGDPLEEINRIVNLEGFRKELYQKGNLLLVIFYLWKSQKYLYNRYSFILT